uniref:HDC14699 n=1 Tax=Drosophila melanogaster TaxID=7227 RepID=Q6IJK8_DROME|nr:TPA_inf: HDC14699 [Drosophila melanogaster]
MAGGQGPSLLVAFRCTQFIQATLNADVSVATLQSAGAVPSGAICQDMPPTPCHHATPHHAIQ